MKFANLILAVGLLTAFGLSAQDGRQGDYIKLLDPLDEPEFYCFDLTGWGDHLVLDDPLQTHTCKTRGGDDQMFSVVDNRIEVAGTDRCIQVAGSGGGTLAGSAVLARTCAETALQDISLTNEGQLMIGDSGFCIGSGNVSREASGPSHVWRTMIVVDCSAADESLMTWQVGL